GGSRASRFQVGGLGSQTIGLLGVLAWALGFDCKSK
ncbi:MAG: hypothetical protein ACI9UA_005742, partial [Pseudoalteromonas tetraodonis]